MRRVWIVVILTACGGKDASLGQAIAPAVAAGNGAIAAAKASVSPAPVAPPSLTVPQPAAPARRLMLTLRSTPPGAAASVDGRLVGTTPVRWEMDDDGRAHDFGFVLSGHAPWKLHFSPSRDGVIHAALQEVPETADAGAN